MIRATFVLTLTVTAALAAQHHVPNTPHCVKVLHEVARDNCEVGDLAYLYGPDLVAHSESLRGAAQMVKALQIGSRSDGTPFDLLE